MQLLTFGILSLVAINVHALPQQSNTTVSDFPESVLNVNAASIQNDTSLSAPREAFESRIRQGLRFLQAHGAGTEYHLHGILARPDETESATDTPSGFSRLTLLLADRASSAILYSEYNAAVSAAWGAPRYRPFIFSDMGGKLWNFDDVVLKLSEAFEALSYARRDGPWKMLLLGWPEVSPIAGPQGNQPWFCFYDAVNQGRIVMVGASRPVVVTKDSPRVNELNLLKNMTEMTNMAEITT